MLLEVLQKDFDINDIVNDICGKEYTILNRILENNYASCRYKLLQIKPAKFNIDLECYTESVYLNFDLRNNGIVFYFRFRNTEYVEFCKFNQFSFQSNDNSFIIQTDQNIYDFQILDKLNHKKFLIKLYRFIIASKK
ncbi:MAG: hypothetical protein CMD22_00220 [Flavobacteriales bacterium]|nr:hypothetical protein [Flavobacteriales bacterium]|tara:strand:+ start:1820 stop:2230 length:411 start_codon:yes stop_codon:yes gene_type:complete